MKRPSGRQIISAIIGVALAMALLAAIPQSATPALAADCTFAAPVPYKDGRNVKAKATNSGCGSFWTLTIQRHRWGSWWQNEANNVRSGSGTVTATAGCVSGTWTYRSVLKSSAGHQSVSAHARIKC